MHNQLMNNDHIRGYSSGSGGIRTRDFFSAIDEQVGEKGNKTVYYVYCVPKPPYNLLRSLPAVTAYLFPNCSRSMTQGKATQA
jgi:hypothetical protein